MNKKSIIKNGAVALKKEILDKQLVAIDRKINELNDEKYLSNFFSFNPEFIGDVNEFFDYQKRNIKEKVKSIIESKYEPEFMHFDNLIKQNIKEFIDYFKTLEKSSIELLKDFYDMNYDIVIGDELRLKRSQESKNGLLVSTLPSKKKYKSKKLKTESKIEKNVGFNLIEKSSLKISFQKKLEFKINKDIESQLDVLSMKIQVELKEKIERARQIKDLNNRIRSILGNGFNLTGLNLHKLSFDEIDKYSKVLNANPQINKLIDMLGKFGNSYKKLENNMIKFLPFTTDRKIFQPTVEEIVGISIGNDMSKVLPYEIALLKSEKMKKAFMLKYAEEKLLSFEYGSFVDEVVDKPVSVEELEKNEVDKKGPFIVVNDTSGSMEGDPEIIAKAISLAALRIALKQDRKLSIVNFSTQYQEMVFSREMKSISGLINFLSESFGGGTDFDKALIPSINRMKMNDWKNSDLLVISDFNVDNVDESIVEEIKILKQKNNRFHALLIGNTEPNYETLSIFDNKYYFDISKMDNDDVLKKLDILSGSLEFKSI